MSPEFSLNLQGGRFQKRQSGNPKGKPKGTGNWTKVIKFLSVLTANIREGITPSEARTVMDLAKGARKSLGVAELEQRLSALEERAKSSNM